MAPSSAFVVVLTPIEQAVLRARARSTCSPHRDVLRARVVLAAAAGRPNEAIAVELGICVDTVRKWRKRFTHKGLPGLEDLPRSGRPRRFTPVQVAEVKALACTPPAQAGVALSRWSSRELAARAVTAGITASVSASTIRRWLRADAIRPWQHRSWIFPRDPDFAFKAARVLDLYARTWNGHRLGPRDYVISADEKSQLQALHRCHPASPTAPGRTRRVEFEYRRGGTLAYFAAYDVHRAKVIGTIAPRTGIEPFTELVATVMNTEPYASARRVFWIVDNGSSHNGAASAQRMHTAWPNATLVHLPVHASWLNQVEIYFSILQRKAISPVDFADLDELAARILAFQDHYNAAAEPFDWTYTRTDLNAFLTRLSERRPDTLPTAA
ncbi:MAG TPA: IS630 family transposase [Sporichthyaceae bacterium]|jgi:transposase|nr:IS630 family transposase [Sporichthyaceae bacterium]